MRRIRTQPRAADGGVLVAPPQGRQQQGGGQFSSPHPSSHSQWPTALSPQGAAQDSYNHVGHHNRAHQQLEEEQHALGGAQGGGGYAAFDQQGGFAAFDVHGIQAGWGGSPGAFDHAGFTDGALESSTVGTDINHMHMHHHSPSNGNHTKPFHPHHYPHHDRHQQQQRLHTPPVVPASHVLAAAAQHGASTATAGGFERHWLVHNARGGGGVHYLKLPSKGSSMLLKALFVSMQHR
jgi:hypothetical protein